MKRSNQILCVILGALSVMGAAGTVAWIFWRGGLAPPGPDELVGFCIKGDLVGVESCLRRGADPNAPSRWGFRLENEGQTPLTAAAQFGRLDIVRLLLRHGADPNLLDGGPHSPQQTPLSTAAMHGQLDICRVLLEAAADPNLTTRPRKPGPTGDWTALDWALQGNLSAVAELLRQHGAVEGARPRHQP